MLELRSSNPVIADDQLIAQSHAAPVATPATIAGVAQKTAIAVTLAVAGGIGGAALVKAVPGAMIGIMIGSMVVTLVTYFSLWRNPARAVWAAPLYSVAQGASMGALALVLDAVLASRGISALGGLGLQAFVITLAITAGMLITYRAGLIRPNATFVAIVSTLTIGVAIASLGALVLSFFNIHIPGFGLMDAMQGGKGAMIGIGINALILILASMWLVIDFGAIESAIATRVGKEYEWYFAFALMVTLVWIYLEALKLAFRVAMAQDRR